MRLNIFLIFLALFAVTTSGHIYTIDSYLNFAVTESIGSHGTLQVPRFMMTVEGKGGRYYSKLGIGQSLADLPLYWLGSLIERAAPGHPAFRAYSTTFTVPHEAASITGRPQTLINVSNDEGARVFFTALTNAFIAAALCLVFWCLLKDFGLTQTAALWGTALLAFSTPLWVYSRDLFAEPMFAVCLMGTFMLLKDPAKLYDEERSRALRRILLAGLLSCLGILARLSYLPIVAVFAVYVVIVSPDRKAGIGTALRYVLYCLPALAVVALLNLWRFGGVTLTGYHTAFDKGFSVPLAEGLSRNLVSPYRSIFIYAPAVVLFFVGLRHFARRHGAQTLLITAIVAYVLLVYSKWWAWHGGWCWGPRFLVPVVPLLLIPGLVAIERYRRWLLPVAVGLGLLGFAFQLGAVCINYTAIYDYWIQAGNLDWAEANIHMFSPVTDHLRAMLATSPAHYDLWIVQVCQVSRAVCLGALVAFAGTLAFAVGRLVRGSVPDEQRE